MRQDLVSSDRNHQNSKPSHSCADLHHILVINFNFVGVMGGAGLVICSSDYKTTFSSDRVVGYVGITGFIRIAVIGRM